MDFDQLNKKITYNFVKGNYRETFNDLIKIYKYNKKSDISNKIGVVLLKLNKKKFARKYFEISAQEDQNNFKPFFNLSNLLKKSDSNLSEKYIDLALKIENKPEAIILKSHLLINRYQYIAAIKLLKEIKTAESFYLLGLSHLALGNDEISKLCFNESIKFKNNHVNFLNLNTFPRVYKKSSDIKYFRKKFENLINEINLSIINNKITIEDEKNIITSKTNFNLAYQQKNDIELNTKYFSLLNNILKKNEIPKLNTNKDKILFISGFFFKHTVSKLFFNFINEFSKIKKLKVSLLHISDIEDDWTNMYRDLDIKFYKITNIQKIFKFLNEESFGSILFLDHSMNNISQALINKKYAKNYFVFWGHPITTGSKNMDYFISSDLMDKGNQNHYSEKLILLDGIGFNYKIDNDLKDIKINTLTIKENSFYIPQGLFKFLPKYDYLLGEILDSNKKSTISFIKDKDPFYNDKFINRLKRVKKINKNFDRLIFLEGMSQVSYYKKLASHKIILDSIGWSGGNTSMEALYLDKPIVTLQGKSLRANHTVAMLKQINLDILIANNYEEYIFLAGKLIKEEEFFKFIVDKIKKNKHLIFEKQISLYEKIRDLL